MSTHAYIFVCKHTCVHVRTHVRVLGGSLSVHSPAHMYNPRTHSSDELHQIQVDMLEKLDEVNKWLTRIGQDEVDDKQLDQCGDALTELLSQYECACLILSKEHLAEFEEQWKPLIEDMGRKISPVQLCEP